MMITSECLCDYFQCKGEDVANDQMRGYGRRGYLY